MGKEIRVDGGQSDWYKEAIFILKEESQDDMRPKNLVDYADQLIEKHMKLGTGKKIACCKAHFIEKGRWIDYFFWGSIIFLVVVCILYFIL